jgi:hypothetical protein
LIATNQEAIRDIITDTFTGLVGASQESGKWRMLPACFWAMMIFKKSLPKTHGCHVYKNFDWHIVSEKYTQIATFIVIQDETINESRHDKK